MSAIDLFFELYSGLPRQGPGDPASTRRALGLVPPLGPEARILDLGCGTGAQTFALAAACPAAIEAIDFHPPFVAELNATAQRLGLDGRVRARVGDITRLDLPAMSCDLIWCEGAIYIPGFDVALAAWRPLVRPGGHLVASELCWLAPDPPRECADYVTSVYPAIRDVAANRAAARSLGYALVDDFVLPADSWWTDYYRPLEANLAAFRARHPGDPEADAVARETEVEIDAFRRFSAWFGYVFFVLRGPV